MLPSKPRMKFWHGLWRVYSYGDYITKNNHGLVAGRTPTEAWDKYINYMRTFLRRPVPEVTHEGT